MRRERAGRGRVAGQRPNASALYEVAAGEESDPLELVLSNCYQASSKGTKMATSTPDLTVRGEAVERVYGNFSERRYVVNRRYQRKLIWTLDEKRAFIDSIINGYPVPIILLAENSKTTDNLLEIIDGMQRLDAIVSFIENKFDVDGKYFDLNTIAVSKSFLDSGVLSQRHPIFDRGVCVEIASYLLPLSIYEFIDDSAVDTVFRRINSGGRQLSRQEIRSAGSVDYFATVVRRISAKVRGDDSHSDILRLNEMQNISITNRELDYGIDVDELFWVREGILSKEHVRQSRDEELVADLVAYMSSTGAVSSRTEFLDDYYGLSDDAASKERFDLIDKAIRKRGLELVTADFQRTLDQLKLTIALSSSTFAQLLFHAAKNPVPRYFQVVFLALHELIVKKNLQVNDRALLVEALRGLGDTFSVQEGGRWGAENRQTSIEQVVGVIQKAFGPSQNMDPALVHWITQLENLLSQSFTEQAAYDFKQGFLSMDGQFNEESFRKIMKTCAAISNIGRGHKGYVIVGIVDSDATAAKLEEIYGIATLTYDRFRISGVEHEANATQKTLDQFFQNISDKVASSKLSEPLRSYVTSNLKPVRYYDKTIYVFEVVGQEQPSLYDSKFYHRVGAQVKEIEPADLASFIQRYSQ